MSVVAINMCAVALRVQMAAVQMTAVMMALISVTTILFGNLFDV
jgi:hypothetical protein